MRIARSRPRKGTPVRARQFQLIVVISSALLTACSKKQDRADPPATGSQGPGGEGKPVGKVEPSQRSRLVSHRPLLDEVVRAELDAGGLVIDFGTADQHKYTRGGWRTGWGDLGAGEGSTWGALASRRGFLELPAPRTPPAAITLRARSKTDGQKLSVFVGDRELGTVELGAAWAVGRVTVPADAIPTSGVFRLELRASAKATNGARADIDWLWLGGDGAEPTLGPRILPLEIAGTPRRALAAPTGRTYSFYLQPPAGAQLVVDLGAAETAEFVIAAATDGGAPKELLRETIAKAWTERAVDLGAFAGRAVRLDLTTTRQTGAVGWGEPELMVPAPSAPAPVAGGAPPKNVIVLVMDTARADAFGPFAGKDRVAKTPRYDALAKQSTVFTAAYDNENWTKPSVATTLSGLYPSTHDTKHDVSKLSADVELVSERLKHDGFATAGFVANGYVSDKFGFDQGWDVFKNYIRESKPSEAEHVFGDALAWHASHAEKAPAKPFFLYLQTIDPHVTYRVDKEFWGAYFEGDYTGPLGPSIDAEDQVKLSTKKLAGSARDLAWLRANYWGEISYHDLWLGKFLDELTARGAWKDTLLVITNDHGEELGERGRFGHGHQTFEEMIRAPLLFHYPPMFPATELGDVVEHVDLAPTVLDALGRDPLKNADGQSFLPLVRGQPMRLPRYAVIEFLEGRRVLRVGAWKLFARTGGEAELFDLAADPGEERDLAATAPLARRLCEIHLGEALATPDKGKRMNGLGARRRFRSGAADIGPQMRRQLEALGYFGGGSKPGKEPDDTD